jgi:hypothetical protein
MSPRFCRLWGLTVAALLLASGPAGALEPGDDQYPNSIIAPEPGAHRPLHAVRPLSKQSMHRHVFVAHGSSGSVLPTPLPRTQAIPPEGGGIVTTRTLPRDQGPTILPGRNPIPNLPHGPETFQDRASRCAFQQGLNGVPATASNQYMGACVQ